MGEYAFRKDEYKKNIEELISKLINKLCNSDSSLIKLQNIILIFDGLSCIHIENCYPFVDFLLSKLLREISYLNNEWFSLLIWNYGHMKYTIRDSYTQKARCIQLLYILHHK